MALNALSLSVAVGYAGYSYKSAVVGLSAGTEVDIRRGFGDGFGYSNGFVRSESLPTPNSWFELIEKNPLTGETRTTRLEVQSARYDLDAKAAMAANPTATSVSPTPITNADGSRSWGTAARGTPTGTVIAAAGGSSNPAPSFTVAPSISPAGGAVGQLFTGSDGTIANGTVASRRWLLNGAPVSTATTYLSTTGGSLVYEVTASGPGGSAVGTSVSVTISAASLRSAAVAGMAPEGSSVVTAGVTRAVHRAITIPEMYAGSTEPLRWAIPYFAVPDGQGEVVYLPQDGTTLSAQLENATGSAVATCLTNLAVFPAKGIVWTDYVTPAQVGLASWPVDARTFFLKWQWDFPATGTNRIFVSDSSGGSTGSSGEGTAFGGSTTMGVYGGATGGGGTSQATRIARPWLCVGMHSKPAIAGVGHSMMWGQADGSPGTVGQDAANSKNGGYWGRATVRGMIPTTKIGKPADRIAYWAVWVNTPNGDGTYTSTATDWTPSALRREAIGLYHQWAVFDQGFNDLSNVDPQIVFAQVRALCQKLKADYPSLKIAWFEQSIRVSSASGNWTNSTDPVIDQTAQANYTDSPTSARSIFNALLRGAVGTFIDRTINNVPLYNDPARPDTWFSDGTAKKATVDGTHLRPYSQDLVATNLVNNHFPAMT